MKLDARQVAGFLRDPGATRLVLLHGEDEGLIRERAQALTRHIAGTLTDPFLTTELTRERWPHVPAEMSALSMIGGRRVIVVRDATDAILPYVREAIDGPGTALLILEAPGLARGKLRSYAETAPQAASLASYTEEGATLQASVTRMLAEHGIRADPDALALLCRTLAGDRAVTRGEIEKLALFVQPGQTLDTQTVLACTGDGASGSADDAILAMSLGDTAQGDATLEAALADGLNGVALLRIATAHLQKLHQAKLRTQDGMTPADAVRAMRPPVFFKAVPAMTRALNLWSADALLKSIAEARKTELACKQTGSLPDLLARRYFHSLARRAQARHPGA